MNAKVLSPEIGKTKAYLEKIGKIIVLFGHLEMIVDFFIWELINAGNTTREVQSIGRRITTPLDYKSKINLVRSIIVERLGEDKAKEFTPIYTELLNCAEIRNDIAHSQWFIEYGNKEEKVKPETQKVNWQKAYQKGKGFDFSGANKDVSLKELDEYTKKLSKTTSTFAMFVSSL